MTARNKPLRGKRAVFVQEFLLDGNASAAARRAGYSAKSSGAIGAELLKFPAVSRAIADAQRARSERTQVDADFVLHKLTEILNRTMAEIAPALDRKGKPMRDGDGNPVYKFDAANSLRSLELLGKHIAVQAFNERVEVRDTAAMIAALHAGRRRASRVPLPPGESPPVIDVVPESGVAKALEAGRRRASPMHIEGKNDE
jgi:phage terminase small subunit